MWVDKPPTRRVRFGPSPKLLYGLWRFVQAWLNPVGREGAEGVVARDGFGISGVIHLALAVTALGLLMGSSQSDGHL